MALKVTPMQGMAGLVALTLIMGGGNLYASWAEVHDAQAAQRQAGAVLERKLCATFGKLGALKPPPGDPAKNPSRAYEQEQHAALVQLGDDLGCGTG